ncbi:hypothetical protein MKJ04_20790 [Pontibacter sp. E15-1]|uniref:hypothetical protein n=1 Tax=Pontibacter sp. E15-1 TaxID=2919918 RepID=UPI001F4F179E|nr:hypothetical protein [Pontibacter sp. E15-1]MCJ8167290.1 hypothetical protein [Pontibacter sp. E15-1]
MKDRNLEKLFYKLATLLVACGIAVRFFDLSENMLGLHMILSGLLAGLVAILLHMRHANEMEQKKSAPQEKQLKKN